MSDQYKIENLFPVGVYKSKVNHILNDKEKKHIESGQYTEAHNNTFTDYNFFFLDNPIFSKLKKQLQIHVNNYTKDVFKYDSEVYITSSWLNVNPPGTGHIHHNHCNSVFSGVYYIKLPPGSPFLNFYSPINHMFFFNPTEHNTYNSNCWTIDLEEKDVVIFPSTLYHEVLKNNTKENRICIAFNTFVRGYIGEKLKNSKHNNSGDSTYIVIK
jgi:uncharacterized protein (TIGR02466 family)